MSGGSNLAAGSRPSPAAKTAADPDGENVTHSVGKVRRGFNPSGGHCPSWHQVSLPFGLLQMTMLLESCARGEEARVAAELERLKGLGQAALDAELCATDDWASSSPLHWAAYAGSAACVHMLIEAGAKHSATNARDVSQPLHLSARQGHQAAAQALLDGGADVNAVNARGNTALHESCASLEGSGVVETLLRARTNLEIYNDPNAGDRMMTPLLVAAETGSLTAMRLLLQRGANPQAFVRGASVNPDGGGQKKKGTDISKLMARNVMGAVRDAKRRRSSLTSLLSSGSSSPRQKMFTAAQLSASVQPTSEAEAEAGSASPAESASPPVSARRTGFTAYAWSSAAQKALTARRNRLPSDQTQEEGDFTVEQLPGEPQVKLQAVHVALAKGNLLCVAELLEWLWRAKGQACTRTAPIASRLGPWLGSACPRVAHGVRNGTRCALLAGGARGTRC